MATKTKAIRTTKPAGAQRAKPKRAATTGSLTEKVYARLRREILTCVIEPGQDISEAELASQFGVSKTPVREALATLRSDGLVRAYPRRGYQVVPITIADMNELFALRTVLEAGAVELACHHITDEQLDELRALAEVTYTRDEHMTLERFINANHDFHSAIAAASGSERLRGMVDKTVDESERFFYLGAQKRDINEEVINEHLKIVDVLRKRDSEQARALVTKHIDKTRRNLLDAVLQRSKTTIGLGPLASNLSSRLSL